MDCPGHLFSKRRRSWGPGRGDFAARVSRSKSRLWQSRDVRERRAPPFGLLQGHGLDHDSSEGLAQRLQVRQVPRGRLPLLLRVVRGARFEGVCCVRVRVRVARVPARREARDLESLQFAPEVFVLHVQERLLHLDLRGQGLVSQLQGQSRKEERGKGRGDLARRQGASEEGQQRTAVRDSQGQRARDTGGATAGPRYPQSTGLPRRYFMRWGRGPSNVEQDTSTAGKLLSTKSRDAAPVRVELTTFSIRMRRTTTMRKRL